MKYNKFEDTPVWQESRHLIKLIYQIYNIKSVKQDYPFMDQMRRAAISIALNIAEGFDRKSNKDFAKFINQAKSSSGEVRCGLYIALGLGYISQDQFDKLILIINSIGKQLGTFEKYLLKTHKKN